MKTYVLYHANCTDGMGAKYAAWKYFGMNATYIPCSYEMTLESLGENHPNLLKSESTVYLVDFCFPRQVIIDLASKVSQVVILDHHVTAEDNLKGLRLDNLEIVFDMKRSGAVITWNYFHPDTPIPTLLRYVEDRDLWTWKLPNSRTISSAINLLEPNLNIWENIVLAGEPGIDDLYRQGVTIDKANDQLIDRALKQVATICIDGHFVPCVNSTVLMSEIGERMLSYFPEAAFSASYIIRHGNIVQFSLRSRVNSEVDVAAIARNHGGGGHKHASGFITNLEGLMRILKNVQLAKE